MSSFLTYEEMRLWRSSTEKITLEEFAARLGKKISDEKETKDLHDIIVHNVEEPQAAPVENVKTVIEKMPEPVVEKQPEAIVKAEPEIKPEKVKVEKQEKIKEEKPELVIKAEEVVVEKAVNEPEPVAEKPQVESKSIDEQVEFSKKLAPREETIFQYLIRNKGKIVQIGDLARLLGLPNAYVYKYIKGLREKMVQNLLDNADNGGYILNI